MRRFISALCPSARVVKFALALASIATLLLAPRGLAAQAPSTWPMIQRDSQHTGRADYWVPASRQNSTFFDFFAWQTRSPGSPGEGAFGATQMSFFDDKGPNGSDLIVGTYRWPKGIAGLDRHDGTLFWSGNTEGGEVISNCVPAFRGDGEKIYVINDATQDGEYPYGHPLMSFWSTDGPANYIHNGSWADPYIVEVGSPVIGPGDWILAHQWSGPPAAAWDNNLELFRTYHASTAAEIGRSAPAASEWAGDLHVLAGTRAGEVVCWDYWGDEVWRVNLPDACDATITLSPENDHAYVSCGVGSIWVVGLDRNGMALWGTPAKLVYDDQGGTLPTERASSAGCLSWNGDTYYFQTTGSNANGKLYAINTANGTVRWTLATQSWCEDEVACSPIVTGDGLIIVGNNDGDTYFVVRDAGNHAEVLDTLAVDPAGNARSSASLSNDGLLYLPLRTAWVVGNGNGEIPSYTVENLFSAINLTETATVELFPPSGQRAYIGNARVTVQWRPILDPSGSFDHYAVYRSTAPFESVEGMAPIGIVNQVATAQYVDATAQNGVSYYYAVTTVADGGGENHEAPSVGPRTPRNETDLQVVSISRTPRYPRYSAQYTEYEITEPNGYGPYIMSAATGLGDGQDANTQRFPNPNDPITYTATVRNRGTNSWSGQLSATWILDSTTLSNPTHAVSLAPGESHTFSIQLPWTAALHTLRFRLHPGDSRPSNDWYDIDTHSIAFLSFVDRTWLERFRELSATDPRAQTDDWIDFVHQHVAKMNELFQSAGAAKRIHYDVLEVLEDDAPDPSINGIDFAIFPFRWRFDQGYLRDAGYYDAASDIDFGLLHEWAHQLGLIDIYQLNLEPWQNEVNGEAYRATECLMHGCSHFFSEHSRHAMDWWQNKAHGYFGQYIYCLPDTVKLRVVGLGGGWLPHAQVKVYQMAERPGLGKVLSNQVKFAGETDGLGLFTFPNVPIDPAKVPTTHAGDQLRANPFGYVAVIGTNGLFLIEVEYEGETAYTWLDITEVNNAYWDGDTSVAIFDRDFLLGGELEVSPPTDMTEQNAAAWSGWADGSWYTLTDDTARKHNGAASVRINTGGGFDTYARYPGNHRARWNLSNVQTLRGWFYAENPFGSFQDNNPKLVLHADGGTITLRPNYEVLNEAIGQWREIVIPLAGDATWERTVSGTPDITQMRWLELHMDTWEYGFTVWMDGLHFDPPPLVAVGEERPDRLALAPAAPNPMRDAVTLRFDLPTPSPVRLSIFDASGRRVRSLVDAAMDAGRHAVAWDGRDAFGHALANGVYLVRLETGAGEEHQKVVLTR